MGHIKLKQAGSNGEDGFIAILICIVGFLVFVFAMAIFAFFFLGNTGDTGSPSKPLDDKTTGSSQDKGKPSDGALPVESVGDLNTAGLVCCNLPGIPSGRMPALDRRVARLWLKVKQDLDSQGKSVTFRWAFRTNCQQKNVDSGGNLKARPGTSPHEAGRALDCNGMSSRKDASEIIATFQKYGWRWLGRKDPPHFEIPGAVVGEDNHIKWIQKIQTDYQNGAPAGCRGAECAD